MAAAAKRIEELAKKVNAGGGDKDPTKEDAPGGQESSPTYEKLKGVVGHHLAKVENILNNIEKELAGHNMRGAKQSLAEANREWKAFVEWNAGKYDPKHPQVLAVARRIEMARTKVAEADDTAAAEGASLKAIVKIMAENKDRLNKVDDESRGLLRNYSSTKSDFDMGRADLKKLRGKMEGLRTIIGRFNDLLPPARAVAAEFKKQFPDRKVLSQKFGQDGWEADDAANRIASFPDLWLTELKRLVDDAFESATANISEAESKLASVAGKAEAIQENTADSAEKWALGFADLLLDFPDIAFPELSDEARKAVPEFVKARKEYLARIAPLRKRIDAIAVQVGKLRKQTVDAARRRIGTARFPKSEYTGGQWKAAEKDIRAAWARRITDKQLLKISIYSPWEEREEARWRNDRWIVGTYRYIGANCLAKLADGKHMVYRMTFRNTKQGGGWSELAQWSVGHVYEILPENADK